MYLPIKTWMDNIIEGIKHRAWIFEKRRIKPRRDQLGDFLLRLHRRRTPDGRGNWKAVNLYLVGLHFVAPIIMTSINRLTLPNDRLNPPPRHSISKATFRRSFRFLRPSMLLNL